MCAQNVKAMPAHVEHAFDLGVHGGKIDHMLKNIGGKDNIKCLIIKRNMDSIIISDGKNTHAGMTRIWDIDRGNTVSSTRKLKRLIT